MLGLLLAQALLSYDICLSGVMQALRLRFDQTSMLFVVLCAVIVDAFFAVMQGRTPFCTVASVLLLLALWGRSLLYEARRRSLRATRHSSPSSWKCRTRAAASCASMPLS